MFFRICLAIFFSAIGTTTVLADRALIAVATNFAETAKVLAEEYRSDASLNPDEIEFVFGSTGKLYAQITRGAPFDAFLAADQERPRRLADDGLGSEPFTFAQGILVWWPEIASPTGTGKIAIANPELAPYGRAALDAIAKTEHGDKFLDRLVYGENVGQAFAMIKTGNASHGLVARASVLFFTEGREKGVEADGYKPISQDAILLTKGQGNSAAEGFLKFLVSPTAAKIIEKSGYRVPVHD